MRTAKRYTMSCVCVCMCVCVCRGGGGGGVAYIDDELMKQAVTLLNLTLFIYNFYPRLIVMFCLC